MEKTFFFGLHVLEAQTVQTVPNMSGCGNISILLKSYPSLYSTLTKDSGTIAPYSLTKEALTHSSPVSHK